MFLGHFGVLMNPAAIQLLKVNAYAAARATLGPSTSKDTLFKAAEEYVRFVQPRTNRALTVFEISHDYNFNRIAQAAKDGPKKSKGGDTSIDTSDYGLTGSMFGGIPNWALYAGVGVGGYYLYKKKGKLGSLFKAKPKTRRKTSRRRSIASSLSAPMIGGAA